MGQSESQQWYVVYSKPHKEELALFYLQSKGVETFLPRLVFPESLNKHRRIVPLFPNYLFVRIRLSEQHAYVVWSPGVKCFVNFNGVPAPLDDEIVEFLMKQADPEGAIAARSNLKPKQEILITGGPFDGLVGIIQEPPDAKGRVKVLLNLLSRQVKAEVPVQFVRSGWVV
jgi:transcriptional antiterminator RfaH